MPTIATLIHEFCAPVQPEDCKEANRAALARALAASGPVVHRGQVFSAEGEGVKSEGRPYAKVPATDESPERDPTDAELAEQWGLPLACETPLEGAKTPEKTPETTVG